MVETIEVLGIIPTSVGGYTNAEDSQAANLLCIPIFKDGVLTAIDFRGWSQTFSAEHRLGETRMREDENAA